MTATNDHTQQRDVLTGTYAIDPARTLVRFATRAMFGLVPVRGTFRVGSGTISVAGPAEESTVDAIVLAASFASGIRRRDDHVRSADFLDAATYPELRYRGERFEGSGVGGTLHGRLTVRDVTRPVALEVETVSSDGRELTARAATTIDRYAFGVTTAPGMAGRRLRLTLEVVAVRS